MLSLWLENIANQKHAPLYFKYGLGALVGEWYMNGSDLPDGSLVNKIEKINGKRDRDFLSQKSARMA
jgi:hypothetical protein